MDRDLYADISRVTRDVEDDAVRYLQRLVRIPSENPPGDCAEVAKAYADMLSDLGYAVELIPVPEDVVSAHGLLGQRVNVIGTLTGNREGRTLLLNGHLDTVPAGRADLWTHPPFAGVVADGRVWGRGASDSKGRMVGYAMAGAVLHRLGGLKAGKLLVTATADEETGGELGAGYLVETCGVLPDAAVVEGYNESIVHGSSGILWPRITLYGKASHGSIPHRGVNAIDMAMHVIQRLNRLADDLKQSPSAFQGIPHTTVNVGTIAGGTKTNVVPDHCEITVDFRVMPDSHNDYIKSELERILAELKDSIPAFNANLQYERDIPAHRCPPDAPIIQSLQRAARLVRGEQLPVLGEPGGTDARWFNWKNIPAVNYGPGHLEEGNFHGVDENMEISRLTEATELLALAISDFTEGRN